MRSVEFSTFGDPAEVLHLAERPKPEPGPGEIRVRMVLSPIHNHDIATIRGIYGVKPPLPAIGGTEALGIVDAHGEGVTAPAVGQRVTMAGLANNAWAEYFVAPAKRAVPLPDAVGDDIGCQLGAMPLSAMMALEDLGAKPGEWMIQNAATGAVGKTLAMIAEARGIHVVNLVRRDAGVAELAALGVGNAVSTGETGWQDKVKAITGGAPLVAALDSVGGEESGQLLHLLGDGGQLLSFGAMGGKPMILNPGDLIFKQATVKGFWGYKRSASTSREDIARMFGDLIRLAATGALKLPVEKAFGLDEAPAAARASAEPGRTGKIAFRG
jgi:NADPH:quinone reductase-like Zn-dependent oxidoreductase